MSDELYEFNIEEMSEPIERLFEREFPSEFGIFDSDADLVKGNPRAAEMDLLYLAGSTKHLHAIRLILTYDQCLFNVDQGLHSLSRARGNYLWIALPLDEFREGEAEFNDILETTCQERGVGVITVQPRGRGLSAKVIKKARRQEGDFLEDYKGLKTKWRTLRHESSMGVDGYQVVDYYNR